MIPARSIAALLACVAVWSVRGASLAHPDYDYGPFAARVATIGEGERFTAAGPFFESWTSPTGSHYLAVRPFYGHAEDGQTNRSADDYLWPVAQRRFFDNESASRFLFFFNYDHGVTNENGRYRTWIPPFYFEGRNATGGEYRLWFPIYGDLHEFIGRDTMHFVLFPLYSTSTLDDLSTVNWLWPIYSHTTTPDGHIERFRVFPLYQRSYMRDAWTKQAILWPFWTSVQYHYPDYGGGGWILWPVTGHMKMPDQETFWVLPPLFRYTKSDKLRRLYCPWPVFIFERGVDYSRSYVWPLWGHKRVGNVTSTFFLWPVVWNDHMERGWYHEHLFMVAPFYRHVTVTMKGTQGAPTQTVEKLRKVWPLGQYAFRNGISRFRTLDLWPFAENNHVDLNWAPIWTLYQASWTTNEFDSRLLWGLYRHQEQGDAASYYSLFPFWTWCRDDRQDEYRGWSILRGLFAHERNARGSSWRLLYFIRWGSELDPQQP